MIRISWNESDLFTVVLVVALWVIKLGAVSFLLLVFLLLAWQHTPDDLRSNTFPYIIPLNDRFKGSTLLSTYNQPQRLGYETINSTPPESEAAIMREEGTSEPQATIIIPTSTSTYTATLTPTFTYTPTSTPTFTYTPTSTPTFTYTPTSTPTSTHTPTLTQTPMATFTPTFGATITNTIPATNTSTVSPPTSTPSPSPLSVSTPLFATPIPLLHWISPPGKVCSPLEGISIRELPSIVSSPYNPPPPGSDARHQGVDFAYYRNHGQLTIEGKEVYAILPGKVMGIVENRLPYGNTIVIETRYSDIAPSLAEVLGVNRETSLYHLYAHMQDPPLLALGERVKCGQLIGHVGKSGTIVPHLHLETRMGPAGGWLPSMGFFDPDASEEEKANYLFWRVSGVYKHFDPMKLFEKYIDYELNNPLTSGGE